MDSVNQQLLQELENSRSGSESPSRTSSISDAETRIESHHIVIDPSHGPLDALMK
jgi:hypothetical protein